MSGPSLYKRSPYITKCYRFCKTVNEWDIYNFPEYELWWLWHKKANYILSSKDLIIKHYDGSLKGACIALLAYLEETKDPSISPNSR